MTDPADRRTFLKVIGGACGAAAAGAVGVPAIGAAIAPTFERTVVGAEGFVALIDAAALPADGTPMAVPVVIQAPRDAWAVMPPTEVGAVFLRKNEDGTVAAFSTICPHLGCQVDLKADTRRFFCPCHDSAFAFDGEVLGGPSPRPLDALEVRIAEGKVEVRYERFKTGTAAKVKV
jgi:menaquinol-cytochrome c reductase iron-sulfur subunit